MKTKTLTPTNFKEVDSTTRVTESISDSPSEIKKPCYIRTEAEILRSGRRARLIVLVFLLSIAFFAVFKAIWFSAILAFVAVIFCAIYHHDIDFANKKDQ